MARNDNLIFSGPDWHSVESHQGDSMGKEIHAMDGDRLLNTSPDDVASYFAEKYSIDVPRLIEDRISVDQREVSVDVSHDPMRFIPDDSRPFYIPGTEVIVQVPFEGNAEAFAIRPSVFSLNPPRATVGRDSLTIIISGVDLSPDKVKVEINQTLGQIRDILQRLRSSADALNRSLPQVAKNMIEVRRKKLLQDRNMVASLGFPMRQRDDSSKTFVAPEVRRKLAPVLPKATSAPFKPEPALSDDDYEHILKVVQSMAHVMERSPSAFTSMDEESLRTHFLVQLNGHFEGQATGETFNYQGKTDVLIRSGDRNIFIGECKYWAGPEKLKGTIDQLLGYSAWRDTKTAIILFNRNKDFSRVLDAIPTRVKEHSNFKREIGRTSETVFRYVFASKDDPNREIYLTVLAFDVPS